MVCPWIEVIFIFIASPLRNFVKSQVQWRRTQVNLLPSAADGEGWLARQGAKLSRFSTQVHRTGLIEIKPCPARLEQVVDSPVIFAGGIKVTSGVETTYPSTRTLPGIRSMSMGCEPFGSDPRVFAPRAVSPQRPDKRRHRRPPRRAGARPNLRGAGAWRC